MRIFIAILFSLLATFNSYAQNASLLPGALQQFFDNNGNPLSSGTVTFYIAGTSTLKNVWKDANEAVLWANPITLDAGGKPPGSAAGIYGQGTYRQVVRDRNGNLIWDAVTSATNSGATPTNVGDGNLVGTTMPWSGITAPNQYVFAYGQEISRTTYADTYTALTLQAVVSCTSASNNLTGLSDTTSIPIGGAVEVICVAPGTTVISKTASSVTLSNPASVSINTTARFFMYGNGNGTTTFNLPDMRGRSVYGRANMGGTATTVLTTSGFISDPGAVGATGGRQTGVLVQSNLPPVNFTNSGIVAAITSDPVHYHGVAAGLGTNSNDPTGRFPGSPVGVNAYSNASGVFMAGGASPVAGGGMIAGSSTGVVAAITAQGSAASGGTSVPFVSTGPGITLNYIIKITSDTPSSEATGVASLGGMVGVIACGDGLLCTGNTVSVIGGSSGSIVGTANQVTVNTVGSVSTISLPVSIIITDLAASGTLTGGAFVSTGTQGFLSIGISNGYTARDRSGNGRQSAWYRDTDITYFNDSAQGNIISWSTANGGVSFLKYITAGVLKNDGSGLITSGAALTDLATTTINRLVGTSGSGVPGVVTVPTGLSVASSALNFDIPSLTTEASVNPSTTFALCETAGVTKKCSAGSIASSATAGVASLGAQTGVLTLATGLAMVSTALNFDIPSLTTEASVSGANTYMLCETASVTKKCSALSIASTAAIGNLTATTANRLGGTSGAGVWGIVTVPTGLALASSALTFDIPSLATEGSVDPSLTFALCETAGVTKKCTAGSIAAAATAGVASLGGQTGALSCGSGLTCSTTTINTQSPLIGGTGTTSTLVLQTTSGVGTTNADIIFKVGNNGATEAARILNSGLFGIGTNAPATALDVRATTGVITVGSLTGTNSVFLNTTNTGGNFYVGRDTSSGGTLASGSTAYAGVISLPTAHNLQIGTNNTVRTTITSAGNVGIGTTTPTALLEVAGNTFIKGTKPWADVMAYGALTSSNNCNAGTPCIDTHAAIQSAINAVVAAGGGTVYFPQGIYCLSTGTNSGTGLTISGAAVNLVGAGQDVTYISACNASVVVLNFGLDTQKSSVREMTIQGKGGRAADDFATSIAVAGPQQSSIWMQGDDTQPAGRNCVACIISKVTIAGGYRALDLRGSDIIVEDTIATGAYGDSLVYAGAGMWIRRSKFDEDWPAGGGPIAVAVRGNLVSYGAGAVVSVQQPVTVGPTYLLQCVNCPASSGGAQPALLVKNTNISDGGVVWRLIGQSNYAGILMTNTGGALEVALNQVDITFAGAYNIYIAAIGNSPIKISDTVMSGGLNAILYGVSGYTLQLNNSNFGPCSLTGCGTLSFLSSWTGVTNISNNIFYASNTGFTTGYGGYGIFIVAGDGVSTGVQFNITGNQILYIPNTYSAIFLADNVREFNISNNIIRNGSGTTYGIRIGAGATGAAYFNITSNVCQNGITTCIAVGAGPSDYYTITNNICSATACTTVNDGGTGIHKTANFANWP